MVELFDMYDVNRYPLGHTHPRGVPIHEGEYHIVVQIVVLDSRNRLLLTRRHPEKILGGMWEVTAGSALAGEDSVSGAMRELREETGLEVTADMLQPFFTRTGDHYFLDCYIVRLNRDGYSLNLTMQEGETTEYVWADAEKQQEMEDAGWLVPITVEAREHLQTI